MTLQTTPSGYTAIPFSSLPSKFSIFKTGDTSKYWCYGNNGAQVMQNTSPLLYMYADQPSDIYGGSTAVSNGWTRINLFGSTAGTYCFRHAGYVTYLHGWGSGNFDFAWRFYYQTGGDSTQIIVGNCYPADGTGCYLHDNGDGTVRIDAFSASGATVYTLVNNSVYVTITSYSNNNLLVTFNWTYISPANRLVITWPANNANTSGTLTGTTYTTPSTGISYNTAIQFTFAAYNGASLLNSTTATYTFAAGITITNVTNNGQSVTITWSYTGSAAKVIITWPASNAYSSGYVTGTTYTASGAGIVNNTTIQFTVTPYDSNNVAAGTPQTTSYFLYSAVRNTYSPFDGVSTTTLNGVTALYAAFRASTTYLGPTLRVQQFANPAALLQTFTTVGTTTYTIPAGVYYIQALLVGGGGGGGGGWEGGGGGGGGVLYVPFIAVKPGQIFTVRVGAAGTGGYANTYPTSGGNSSLIYTSGNISNIAYGGGFGGGEQNIIGPASFAPANGGSGGGGSWGFSATGNYNAPATPGANGVVGQGYCGGCGYDPGYAGGGSPYIGGGGGGSGYPGQTPAPGLLYAGNGGHAKTVYMAGTAYTYGGGGGGSCRGNTNTPGMGGAGGGGVGNGNGSGGNATIYGGGGGAAGNNSGSGGNGYQGIVLIATTDTLDFYANANGDFGTALNGTGTSLSTWLAGATGYITTLYDQSGNGNHAYQTSNVLANMPIINPTAKYIDFKPSRYLIVKDSVFPQGNSSYTVITKINSHPTNTNHVTLWGGSGPNVGQYANYSNILNNISGQASASLRGAYSYRLVSQTYYGPLFNIRNGTSSAQADFYSDGNGNLGTVVGAGGTSISSWLNGATGYITIWYDQSGTNRHAMQNIAGLQPQLNLTGNTVNFVDFSVQTGSYFFLPAGTVPQQQPFTFIARHGAVNNAAGGIIGSGAGNSAGNNLRVDSGQGYWNYWIFNDFGASSSYTTGNVVTVAYDGAGSPPNTSGTTTFFVNGTQTNTGYRSGWIGQSGYELLGKTTYDATLNGQLYDVFIFASCLSSYDRKLIETTIKPSLLPTPLSTQSLSLEYNLSSASYNAGWSSNVDLNGGTYSSGNVISTKYISGTGRYLYVNGTQVATDSSNVRVDSSLSYYIGAGYRPDLGSLQYFNGELFSLYVFNVPVTDSDRILLEGLGTPYNVRDLGTLQTELGYSGSNPINFGTLRALSPLLANKPFSLNDIAGGPAYLGMLPSFPAANALQIITNTSNTADGTYYININNVPKATVCLLNPKWDGGGWMQIMKSYGTNTFEYNANYWTTANTLNVTDLVLHNSSGTDAKYDVFNTVPVKDVLALWPTYDIGSGNTGGSLTVSEGWVWKVNNWYNLGGYITPLLGFQIDRPAPLANAFDFDGISQSGSSIFSYMTGTYWHGFGSGKIWNGAQGWYQRWGMFWNDQTNSLSTQDALSGIGINANGFGYSAADRYFWGGVPHQGVNRAMSCELYAR